MAACGDRDLGPLKRAAARGLTASASARRENGGLLAEFAVIGDVIETGAVVG